MFEPLGASGCVREVRSEKEAPWKKCPQSNPVRSLQLQQSHRFTRHRSCGVWHLHLLHCCPAPGAVCWVCRRPGALNGWTHSARCYSSRLSWSWGPRSRVCRTVGLWPCAIIWRARARARGVRTSRCLIRSIGPVARPGGARRLGRTCAGAGGSRCRDV